MKRTLVVLALLLAVGILCFADDAAKPAGITWGSWGRAIYSPLMSADSDTTAGMGTSWGSAMRVGFNLRADSETAGFYVTMSGDNNSIGVPDDVGIYVKPIAGLKIIGGTPFDDTLRNNGAAFGSWNWIRTGDGEGESFGFSRFRGNSQSVQISYKAEGLYVIFMQSQAPGGANLTKYGDGKDVATGGMNNTSFGFGYTVPNMVTIKAAKFGYANVAADAAGWQSSHGLYEFGADIAAIPNLSLSANVWIPTDKDASAMKTRIPVSASYKMDAATFNAFFDYNIANKDRVEKNFMSLGVGFGYNLGDGLSFEGDVRYCDKYFTSLTTGSSTTKTVDEKWADGAAGVGTQTITVDPTEKAKTSFFAGVTKAFAVGSLGVGFQYDTLAFGTQYSTQSPDKAQWAIPVKWEVSF